MKEAMVLLLPFLGTTLGAAMVFFMKRQMNDRLQKLLLGFASGVMIAASVWSLLIPAIEMAEEQGEACGSLRQQVFCWAWDSFCCWTVLCHIFIWIMRSRKA